MGPGEFLGAVDDAIAAPGGRRALVLELRTSSLWDERGKAMDPDDGGARWGYTRRQCVRLRAVVIAGIQSDRAAAAQALDTQGAAP